MAQPTPQEIRAWAREQDSLKDEKCLNPNARGRFSPAVIKAWNAAHKSRKYTGQGRHVPTVALKYGTTDKRGRNRTATAQVTRAEVRRLAGKPGSKGRLSAADLATAGEAYAASL